MRQVDRPLGDLLEDLSNDTQLLVRQELELAKREVSSKLDDAKRDALKFATALAIGLIGAMTVSAGIVLILAHAIPAWLAALIVGTAYCAAAAILLMSAQKSVSELELKPNQTASRVRTDARVLKEAFK